MTKEDNEELLLKDLCARLPYKVKISIPGLWTSKERVETLTEIFKGDDDLYRVNNSGHLVRYIKPYLFPLSTISNETLEKISAFVDAQTNHVIMEFFNSRHIDYRGLIEKGLAIDATGLDIY